jgi:DNA-binding response OmpR family regulator
MADLRRHVLCIDDDRDTAGLLAEELVDRGFKVTTAYDGEQGFQAILARQPDLVLADISMPGLSGFDLLERLTGIAPRFSSMPFLYLTALSDRANELKGRQLGADDYITKPVDFDILTAIITARLTRVARAAVWPRQVELTEREVETLTWAARGKTSSEIAQILGLTKRTVDFHIDNARVKLNASSRMHAAVKAAAGQLIEP